MEELKQFWEFLLDWPLGTIAGILSIIVVIGCTAVVLSIIGSGILSGINSLFTSDKKVGEVIDKK